MLAGVQQPSSIFPIGLSANNRYLINAKGNPFYLRGMALWELEVNGTRAQIDQVLQGCVSQGFNAILVEVAEHLFSFQTPPYQNSESNIPYTGMTGSTPPYSSVNFSALNDAYFQRIDYIVRRSFYCGLLVVMTPAYYGFASTQEGWGVGGELGADTQAHRQAYGAALAKRYLPWSNVMWCWGGDNISGAALYNDISTGMATITSAGLYTGHASRTVDAYSVFNGNVGLFNVNSLYSDNANMVANAATCWSRGIPFFLVEDEYENATSQTNQTQRCQKMQAWCGGARGDFFGNDPMWALGSSGDSNGTVDVATCITKYLYTTASTSMANMTALFRSVGMNNHAPVTGTQLITSSLGTGASAVTPSLANDGSSGIAYVPTGGTVTANLSAFARSGITADWHDPTNNTYTVAASGLTNAGTQNFTTPASNFGGDADFTLRLRC